jgi:hypothetical protein
MMLDGRRSSVWAKSLQEFRRLSPALLLPLAGPEDMAGFFGDVCRPPVSEGVVIGQVVCSRWGDIRLICICSSCNWFDRVTGGHDTGLRNGIMLLLFLKQEGNIRGEIGMLWELYVLFSGAKKKEHLVLARSVGVAAFEFRTVVTSKLSSVPEELRCQLKAEGLPLFCFVLFYFLPFNFKSKMHGQSINL